MKKSFLLLIASILFLTIIFIPTANETAQAKTMWGKIELKEGMIGKVKIVKDTYQYSISKKKLKNGSKLKKGKEYGVYSYSKSYGGIYKIGSNKYVKKNSSIKYYIAPKDLNGDNKIQPKLEISGLNDGLETNDSTHQLSVKTDEGATVTVTLNGEKIDSENNIYEIKLSKEGKNIVYVSSVLNGVKSEKQIEVTYDYDEEVVFKDKRLEREVRQSLGEIRGTITESDMLRLETFRTLYIEEPERYVDLTGLEYAKNLKILGLYKGIENIDLSPIYNLSNLNQLQISHFGLKNIQWISQLNSAESLEYLWLDYNNINLIDGTDFIKFKNLKSLRLETNQLTEIKNLKLNKLENLYLSHNSLDNLLFLENNLPAIKELFLYNNQISDTKLLLNLDYLEYVDLKENPLNNESTEVIKQLEDLFVKVRY